MRQTVAKMNANGFSLIELVSVVAVLGILTAIAIPKYNQLQHDAAISRAKDLLANIIKECIFVDTLNGGAKVGDLRSTCLLYTSPSPRDRTRSRMPSSA